MNQEETLLFDPKLGYTLPYYVYHKDTDFREELRFTAFATCLQESAWAHARVMSVDLRTEEVPSNLWVLSRLDIQFCAPLPRWQDTLYLQTFPVGIEGIFAQRDFIAWALPGRRDDTRPGFPLELPQDTSSLQAFAKVRSSWLIIDAQKRTLVRPQILKADFSAHQGTAVFLPAPAKLRTPDLWSAEHELGPVSYHDIDGLGHVNNVSYFEWALGTYDQAHLRTHALKRASANFNAETNWEHGVRGRSARSTEEGEGVSDTFGIYHTDGQNPAVMLKFDWTAQP